MKRVLTAVIVLVVGGIAFGTLRGSPGSETVNYRLATVEQGDLEAVVSATGTLDAVTTVQVGTQVSGIINEICVDYNDTVHTGQVIARIDTALLANGVAGADAQLARCGAEEQEAERNFKRVEDLHREAMVSDAEFSSAQYALDVARANVLAAQVDRNRAQQNLDYATITAPIDGTVIDRTVDVGQTVQSSFSAPELFLIAGDLTRMLILASVDESDIGLIAEGQTVRFTVQAYPDDVFTGAVNQVRLQSANDENVVSYTAVVDVVNPDGRLLPGMTATVDFLVETAEDVLYVSNASLRYKPDQETVAAAFKKLKARTESAGMGGGGGTARQGADAADRGMLWTVGDDGEVAMIPVTLGISDGSNTAVSGRSLEAGTLVIAGVSSSAAAASVSSPFQQQGGDRGAPPPPGGF